MKLLVFALMAAAIRAAPQEPIRGIKLEAPVAPVMYAGYNPGNFYGAMMPQFYGAPLAAPVKVDAVPVVEKVQPVVNPIVYKAPIIKPFVYEAPKPFVYKVPEVKVVEAPRPIVYQAPKPFVYKVPEVKVVEAPRPIVYQAPKPVVVPEVKVVEAPRPIVYEAPKPVVIKQQPIIQNAPVAVPTLTYAHAPVAPLRTMTYEYQPIQTQYVEKEYEVPIHKTEYVAKHTGCENMFGKDVPCRMSKREAEADHHYFGAGVGYPYTGYPITGYPIAQPVAVQYKALPARVQTVEINKPVFKEYINQVPLEPLCQNVHGEGVPCVHRA